MNNNPPAFPQPFTDSTGLALEGMTLRDYFAAKAMWGLISIRDWPTRFDTTTKVESTLVQGTCAQAYEFADAMLKAREKE